MHRDARLDDLPTWPSAPHARHRPTAARVVAERREPHPVPPLRLLPPEPLRPRRPGVITHPDEVMADNKKVLADLLEMMAAEEVKYALVGGLVAGLYGKDRATVGVDMLVPRRVKARLEAALVNRRYVVKTSEDRVPAVPGVWGAACLACPLRDDATRPAAGLTETPGPPPARASPAGAVRAAGSRFFSRSRR